MRRFLNPLPLIVVVAIAGLLAGILIGLTPLFKKNSNTQPQLKCPTDISDQDHDSYDGQQLAVIVGSPNRIELWPTHGGVAVPLVPESRGMFLEQSLWTDDGKYVVFTKGENLNIDIWRVSPNSKEEPIQLTHLPKEQWATNIRLSPDGKYIYFVLEEPNKHVIASLPIDGGEPTRLKMIDSPKRASNITVSDDGKSLSFWIFIDNVSELTPAGMNTDGSGYKEYPGACQ